MESETTTFLAIAFALVITFINTDNAWDNDTTVYVQKCEQYVDKKSGKTKCNYVNKIAWTYAVNEDTQTVIGQRMDTGYIFKQKGCIVKDKHNWSCKATYGKSGMIDGEFSSSYLDKKDKVVWKTTYLMNSK